MTSPRRPSLLWRLFVLTGVGTATAVSVSDTAWERWKSVFGETLPREAFRNIAVGTAGLHAAEATVALVSAKRNGVEKPGRWAFSTLLWGFPVLRRLGKVKKAGATPASIVDVAGAASAVAGTKVGKKATKKATKKAAKHAAKAAKSKPTTAKQAKKDKKADQTRATKPTKPTRKTKATEQTEPTRPTAAAAA